VALSANAVNHIQEDAGHGSGAAQVVVDVVVGITQDATEMGDAHAVRVQIGSVKHYGFAANIDGDFIGASIIDTGGAQHDDTDGADRGQGDGSGSGCQGHSESGVEIKLLSGEYASRTSSHDD